MQHEHDLERALKPDRKTLADAGEAKSMASSPTEVSRDWIYDRLEEMIVAGEFEPGQRLDERALAEAFHVSRTPVRDAIGRLASIGLIVVKPRSGSYVAKLELADLLHLFETMGELEGLCAQYAAQRIEPQELKELEKCATKCKAVAGGKLTDKTLSEYTRANRTFHETIYAACRNPYLQSITRQTRQRCAAYRNHTFKLPGRLKKSSEEHFLILDAIKTGDSDAARRLMRKHVDIRRDEFAPFIAMMESR